MLRKVLHSKIHLARVTAARPDYVGSITISADLLEKIGLRPNDAVLVANTRNAVRFETYVFRGGHGTRQIEVNGAAAQLVEVGDPLIIMHFAYMTDEEYAHHKPAVLVLDDQNRVARQMYYE
jgi:aspartate 1-decarboxylase